MRLVDRLKSVLGTALLVGAFVSACSSEVVIAPAGSAVDGGLFLDAGALAPDDADAATDPPDEDAAPDDATVSEAGASCSSKSCKNGCCAEGACKTSSPTSCGRAGAACVSCVGAKDGNACVQGACGCSSASNCAQGEICDPVTHRCGASCATEACATGCCSPSGTCSAGTAADACGASGMCANCAQSRAGSLCTAGGKCGCNSADDCFSGQACDLTTHTCTTACSATQLCKGGCCSAGTCRSGSSKTVCGDTGGACADCSANPPGSTVCAFTSKGGTCGCQASTDCPTAMACDPATHTCTTTCSPNNSGTNYCNGGCCDPTTSKCMAGTAPLACGAAPSGFVSICKSCSGSADGPSCLSGKCGCAGASDCGGRTCGSSGRCCDAKGVSCSTGATCCSGGCGGINGVKTCF